MKEENLSRRQPYQKLMAHLANLCLSLARSAPPSLIYYYLHIFTFTYYLEKWLEAIIRFWG